MLGLLGAGFGAGLGRSAFKHNELQQLRNDFARTSQSLGAYLPTTISPEIIVKPTPETYQQELQAEIDDWLG